MTLKRALIFLLSTENSGRCANFNDLKGGGSTSRMSMGFTTRRSSRQLRELNTQKNRKINLRLPDFLSLPCSNKWKVSSKNKLSESFSSSCSGNWKFHLRNWAHSLLPDQKQQEELLEKLGFRPETLRRRDGGAFVVVKIMTPVRLWYLASLANHEIIYSVSSYRSHPTTWPPVRLHPLNTCGLWMRIWTSIFTSQHDPGNHTPLKPITVGALHTVTIVGRFRGKNLRGHDSACYPSAIKPISSSLARDRTLRNWICNRVLRTPCNLSDLVESFFSLWFVPSASFSCKFSGVCVALLSHLQIECK